jgi:hypothetical protein
MRVLLGVLLLSVLFFVAGVSAQIKPTSRPATHPTPPLRQAKNETAPTNPIKFITELGSTASVRARVTVTLVMTLDRTGGKKTIVISEEAKLAGPPDITFFVDDADAFANKIEAAVAAAIDGKDYNTKTDAVEITTADFNSQQVIQFQTSEKFALPLRLQLDNADLFAKIIHRGPSTSTWIESRIQAIINDTIKNAAPAK